MSKNGEAKSTKKGAGETESTSMGGKRGGRSCQMGPSGKV